MIFYAKTNPIKTLIEHSIDSGCAAASILKLKTFTPVKNYLYNHCSYKNKTEENFLNWISYLISLHDVGKCDIKFQSLLDETKDDFANDYGDKRILTIFKDKNFRHEIYGSEIIKEQLKEYNYSKELAIAIRIHHQKINATHHPDMQHKSMRKIKEKQEEEQLKIIKHLKEIFKVSDEIKNVEFDNKSTWWQLFIGLLILSDWIASASEYVIESKENYLTKSYEKAEKLLLKYGLENKIDLPYYDSFEKYFNFERKSLRGIQKLCETDVPKDAKFVLIEAAAGEGKTETAIYTALEMCKKQNKSGLFIGLPTSATSNQMYERLSKVFDKTGNIKLTHSNAWLLDNNAEFCTNAETAKEWMSSTKKAILCQNTVGTVDQSMASVLRMKHSMLKLLGLANKVVILDEMHAYDAYMKTVITRMLEWLNVLNVPVIMLSATLPNKLKEDYISIYTKENIKLNNDYPLITYISKDNELKQISCKSFKNEVLKTMLYEKLEDYDFYAEQIIKEAVKSKYVACVCNSITSAQKTYNIIKSKIDEDIPVYLLHSKFTTEDRQMIEEKLNNIFSKKGMNERPGKCILISTQIVEQSLDFDFDVMFTEIAPIDLLIQRAGRIKRFGKIIKRNNESEEKELIIFTGKDKTKSVYYEYLIIKTEELLMKKNTIKIPEDTREVINYVYKNAMDPEHMMEWMSKYTTEKLSERYAESSIINEPEKERFYMIDSTKPIRDFCLNEEEQYSVTRLANINRTIVFIEKACDLEKASDDFKKAKQLYKKAISITTYGNEISPPPIEGKGFVKNLLGIISEDKKIKIGNREYQYDNENGLKKI